MARRDTAATLRPNALAAAATRIRLDDSKLAVRQAAKLQEWQTESWGFYNAGVPELKHGVWFTGNAMAKLVLYAAVRPADAPPDADPIPIDDENSDVPAELQAAAKAELGRLHSTRGGLSELQRVLNMNLEIAAECYLVGTGARRDPTGRVVQAEEWEVRSISEMVVKEVPVPDAPGTMTAYSVKQGPADMDGIPLDPTLDTAIRIYQRHPQWANMADNHMSGLLPELRILQVLGNRVLAEAMSGLPAELLLLPNELSFGPAVPYEGEGGDEATTDPFEEELDSATEAAVDDPAGSLAAVRPMLVRGPGEFLGPNYVRKVALSRDTPGLEDRIEQHCQRFARGANLPVETVMGHMSTTFANAEQVDQDTWEDYLQPRAVGLVDALAVGYLRPNMADAYPGTDPEVLQRICVWYDPTALIAQPNTEANAIAAHEANLISDSSARHHLGYTDDDAPEPIELLVRAALHARALMGPEVTAALLESIAKDAGVVLPDPTTLSPSSNTTGPAANMRALAQLLLTAQAIKDAGPLPAAPRALAAGSRRHRSTDGAALGRRLMELDRDLRTRLLVSADLTVQRAVEKAGNRLRAKAGTAREVLRTVPAPLAAAALGPTLVAEAGFTPAQLLEDSIDSLEGQFMAWGAAAQQAALNLAATAAAGFDLAQRSTYQLRQAADLAEAWQWLRGALVNLASVRLFDPTPAAPALGEVAVGLSVPAGLVRQAVSRAGGALGLVTDTKGVGHSAWVALTDGGSRPAGGIGTGEVVRDVLREGGAQVEAYQWVYGPAMRARPFEPHEALDGVVFANFDDEVLANNDGFPEGAYYLPGDHAGCICDFAPIIVPADELLS